MERPLLRVYGYQMSQLVTFLLAMMYEIKFNVTTEGRKVKSVYIITGIWERQENSYFFHHRYRYQSANSEIYTGTARMVR